MELNYSISLCSVHTVCACKTANNWKMKGGIETSNSDNGTRSQISFSHEYSILKRTPWLSSVAASPWAPFFKSFVVVYVSWDRSTVVRSLTGLAYGTLCLFQRWLDDPKVALTHSWRQFLLLRVKINVTYSWDLLHVQFNKLRLISGTQNDYLPKTYRSGSIYYVHWSEDSLEEKCQLFTNQVQCHPSWNPSRGECVCVCVCVCKSTRWHLQKLGNANGQERKK